MKTSLNANRRQFLHASLGLGAALALSADAVPASLADLHWAERTWLGLGTTLHLRAAHRDPAQLDEALDAAVARVRQIEAQMSLFQPGSALNQLNRDGQLRQPSADLLAVLRLAQSVAQRSQGQFDVTVQPLWLAFAQAQNEGRLPSAVEVAQARQAVGWRGLEVDAHTLRLARPGMGVTLNGIAQGYAADAVKAVLQAHGVAHALIDTGEWAALGQPAPDRPWQLGVEHPRVPGQFITRLALTGRSLATSADNQCTFSPDCRHHHIFDPRTGYSPTELASVTVAAPSCAVADALTKVMFVAGATQALRLAQAWQVDVLLMDKQGRWQTTPGLRPLMS